MEFLTLEERAAWLERIFNVYSHMQTKIQKWGNSLGLRIPRALAAEAQVVEGQAVDLTVENGCLQIRPLRLRRYALGELLNRVTPDNIHTEISTGGPVGREIF